MISVKLYGRLGNNLAQISTCIATAMRNKTDYMIPDRSVNPKVWKVYFPNLTPQRILAGHKIYKEPHFHYAPIPKDRNIQLDGYWQSYKYFDDYIPQITDKLGFKWQPVKGVVSIHVRRGDYALYPDKHPMLPVRYYDLAILHFATRGYSRFKFFSDDIDWCKKNFEGTPEITPGNPVTFEFSFGQTPLQDLNEMSCCEHNIIANSSFSWWAALANRNPDKIVIAPKVWFGSANSHLDTKDMLPDNWIKLF